MNADKYLESIGLENIIDEEFFNNDDKSWYKVQELMESYYQAKLKLLNIPVIIDELTCDNCGCHPNVIYRTGKGRFCEECKPSS